MDDPRDEVITAEDMQAKRESHLRFAYLKDDHLRRCIIRDRREERRKKEKDKKKLEQAEREAKASKLPPPPVVPLKKSKPNWRARLKAWFSVINNKVMSALNTRCAGPIIAVALLFLIMYSTYLIFRYSQQKEGKHKDQVQQFNLYQKYVGKNFEVTYDSGKSPVELMAGRFTTVDEELRFFTGGPKNIKKFIAYLYINSRSLSSREIKADMSIRGLRPASLVELLAFDAQYAYVMDNLQTEYLKGFIALGSYGVTYGAFKIDLQIRPVYVAPLDNNGRIVHYHYDEGGTFWDGARLQERTWPKYTYFLAVKKD